MRHSTLVNEPSPGRERHRFIVALTVLLCVASLSLLLSCCRSSPESVVSVSESADASGVKVTTTSGAVKVSTSIEQPNQSNARTAGETYGKLPLHFEGNEGQADPHIRFLSRGRGYGLFLTSTEALLSLSKQMKATATKDTSPNRMNSGSAEQCESRENAGSSAVVRMKVVGANV